MNKIFAKAILFDLLAAIFATVVVVLAAVGTHIFTDMRQMFLMMALLFVAVGFLRGNSLPTNGWLKAALLVSPCL